MPRALKVLLVEDSEEDAALILREFKRAGIGVEPQRVWTEQALRAALEQEQWDLVVSDFSMPALTGIRCLELFQQASLDIPFILVSGTVGEEMAVEAMKKGAHDYIMKDKLTRLIPAIQRELADSRVRREHREAEQRLRYLAFYDAITGLPNRTAFQDQVREMLRDARQGDTRLAVILLNVERFAEIVNTLGEETGDRLLEWLGGEIKILFPDAHCIARFSNAEFALLVPVKDFDAAGEAGQRCLRASEKSAELGMFSLNVDLSAGIAVFPDHASTADRLVRRAGIALHHAKQLGRSVSVYATEIDQSNPARLALLGELRQALVHDQMLLHYQPLVDLRQDKIAGAEALIRWQHPRHGMVPPVDFITATEHTGLIHPLTQWVIATAFRQWRENFGADQSFEISINLSMRNLQNPALPGQIENLLRRYDVPAEAFSFEMTESSIMADLATAHQVLGKLRDLGFGLAIDDFGTGHSSLSYIKRLPVTSLKLDRSFICNLTTDEDDFAIVSAMLDLADNLELAMVAEGVENAATLNKLREMDCWYAQGYFISRPLPAPEFSDWRQKSRWTQRKSKTTERLPITH